MPLFKVTVEYEMVVDVAEDSGDVAVTAATLSHVNLAHLAPVMSALQLEEALPHVERVVGENFPFQSKH